MLYYLRYIIDLMKYNDATNDVNQIKPIEYIEDIENIYIEDEIKNNQDIIIQIDPDGMIVDIETGHIISVTHLTE